MIKRITYNHLMSFFFRLGVMRCHLKACAVHSRWMWGCGITRSQSSRQVSCRLAGQPMHVPF